METVKVMSNAKSLTRSLVEKGMSLRDGAKAAGISRKSFSSLARRDGIISPKTAGKLRATFGDDVIRISTAQVFIDDRRRELAELEELREEFAASYPDDSERLQTIDNLIARTRNAITAMKGGE